MRLRRLHLRTFGPFTNRILDFGDGQPDFILLHGPNEAGKSSTLRAISDLRFGIPAQSSDNFIHTHPTMRIGGEFVARDGTAYSLMRRKGRNATLHHVDFSQVDPGTDRPVATPIEALLTGNLTKEQHDSMFGINHERLREGGKALLSGNGEVGAALFEASAGIRSVPKILERLDESARKFFMPGARARNGAINEALVAYEAQQSAVRNAQVRPGTWTDLSKELAAAAQALATADARSREIHEELRSIAEIRAVTPILAVLDASEAIVKELATTPLLATDAASARASAEQGLEDARSNESRANEEAKRHLALIGTLDVEEPILDLETSIHRLTTAVEAMDSHERDESHAEVDVRRLETMLSNLIAQIMAGRPTEDLEAVAPSKASRVDMERVLKRAEAASQNLENHRASKPDLPADLGQVELPAEEIREHLQTVLTEISRNDAHLRRLDALPLEIEAARRELDRNLAAATLDAPAYAAIRPLLDTQIDEAINSSQQRQTQKSGYESRIGDIVVEIGKVMKRRDELLLDGVVPTRDDVLVARGLREAAWNLVRHAYIDGDAPASTLIDDKKRLPAEYEATVKEADALIDALASDTKRAAEYTACLAQLGTLQRDRGVLEGQLAEIAKSAQSEGDAWQELLAAQGLPSYPPAALREWQSRLPTIRSAMESLQQKETEQARCIKLNDALRSRLEMAITEAVSTPGRADATLESLTQNGKRIEERWNKAQAAMDQAVGEKKERAASLKKWERREEELRRIEGEALNQVSLVLTQLLLPSSASVDAARVRIQEFEQMGDLRTELATAQSTLEKAQRALSTIVASAGAIALQLHDVPPADPRHYSARLQKRLEAATDRSQQLQLARQALKSAERSAKEHESNAARHAQTLARLCEAAAVQTPRQLPGIEYQSNRKRTSLDTVDQCKRQLAAASKRGIEELRQLVSARDLGQIDDAESTLSTERDTLKGTVDAARESHRLAKAAFDNIDSSDVAAQAKEAAEQAAAKVRANIGPWIRSRLAHSLLSESLKRFRERAQGPMLLAASTYFKRMTGGKFTRLTSEEMGNVTILVALRGNGNRVHVDDMSEGTRDQLYLSLRLAALDFRRAAGVDLPIILDDILITSDDERALAILEALSESAKVHQVMVFTHHHHIVDLARRRFEDGIQIVDLA